MSLKTQDHFKILAMIMLKHGGTFLQGDDFDPLYEKALGEYNEMLGRIGLVFSPTQDSKMAVIATLKIFLPHIEVTK